MAESDDDDDDDGDGDDGDDDHVLMMIDGYVLMVL